MLLQGKYEWAGQQQQGDCSLRILRANLAYDDGLWECQVTWTQFCEQTCTLCLTVVRTCYDFH